MRAPMGLAPSLPPRKRYRISSDGCARSRAAARMTDPAPAVAVTTTNKAVSLAVCDRPENLSMSGLFGENPITHALIVKVAQRVLPFKGSRRPQRTGSNVVHRRGPEEL